MSPTRRAILSISTLFALSVMLLNPIRDFPLDDSWIYFLSVEALTAHGEFFLPGVATLVWHTLWGAGFAKMFGLSFTTLRLSTLLLSYGCLLLLYALARNLKNSEKLSAMTALLLWANPLFFLLSFTFMTDVPFLFWMLLTLYLYNAGTLRERTSWIWASSITAALAFLIRQNGILLPVGMLLHLALSGRWNMRRALAAALIPFTAAVVFTGVYFFVLGPTPGFSAYILQDGRHGILNPLNALLSLFGRGLTACAYLSLFLSPILIAELFGKERTRFSASPRLFASALSIGFLSYWGGMPLKTRGNTQGTLNYLGMGTVTVGDASAKIAGVFGSTFFWYTLTALTFVALGCLLHRLLQKKDRWHLLREPWFLPALLTGLAPLCWPRFYDRYLIPLLPLALLVGVRALSRKNYSQPILIAGTTGLLLLSILGTMDYLNWNGAKWKAALAGIDQGIPSDKIYAGTDFTGLLHYRKSTAALRREKNIKDIGQWDWINRLTFEAVTSFSQKPPAPDFKRLAEIPYSTPLSLTGQATIYLYTTSNGAPIRLHTQ